MLLPTSVTCRGDPQLASVRPVPTAIRMGAASRAVTRSRLGGVVLVALLVALAPMLFTFLVTPGGLGPERGGSAAAGGTRPTEAASSGGAMPGDHRDGTGSHETHCFWCVVLVGPVASAACIEPARRLSVAASELPTGVERPRGLDLSFASRAPPARGELAL